MIAFGFVPPRSPERVRADEEREERRGPLVFCVVCCLLVVFGFVLLVWVFWMHALDATR